MRKRENPSKESLHNALISGSCSWRCFRKNILINSKCDVWLSHFDKSTKSVRHWKRWINVILLRGFPISSGFWFQFRFGLQTKWLHGNMQHFLYCSGSDSDSNPNCSVQEWDWNRNRNWNLEVWMWKGHYLDNLHQFLLGWSNLLKFQEFFQFLDAETLLFVVGRVPPGTVRHDARHRQGITQDFSAVFRTKISIGISGNYSWNKNKHDGCGKSAFINVSFQYSFLAVNVNY